jgi:hypothetical protein
VAARLDSNRSFAMSKHLENLIDSAKRVTMTPAQREEQRRSFAYGNTKIENARITRKSVDEAADAMAAKKDAAAAGNAK